MLQSGEPPPIVDMLEPLSRTIANGEAAAAGVEVAIAAHRFGARR